jgi:hypothetical protein
MYATYITYITIFIINIYYTYILCEIIYICLCILLKVVCLAWELEASSNPIRQAENTQELKLQFVDRVSSFIEKPQFFLSLFDLLD